MPSRGKSRGIIVSFQVVALLLAAVALHGCASVQSGVRVSAERVEVRIGGSQPVSGKVDAQNHVVLIYAPAVEQVASVVVCSAGPASGVVKLDVPDEVNGNDGQVLEPGRCVDFRYIYAAGMQHPFLVSADAGVMNFTASLAVEGDIQKKAVGKTSPGGIHASVLSSSIQRDRVVIVLDAGSEDGIRVGMKGTLTSGRPLTIISVDSTRSRAVVSGLGVRIPEGAAVVLFPGAR